MSVSSIFSSAASSTDPLSALYAPSTTTASAAVSSSTPLATGAASSTSISSGASLLAQLQQLSFSNPAAFQKATADIATQLQTDAQQTGGSQGQALTSLAAKFQQASQTGDLSPLKPAHAHHGGHHHGGGSAASAAAAYQNTTDSTTATAATSLQSQLSTAVSQALTQDAGTQGALTAQNDLARPISSLAA